MIPISYDFEGGKKATLVQGTPQEVFPPSSVPQKQEGVKTGSESRQEAKQKNDSKEPSIDVVKMLENGLTIRLTCLS